MKLHLPHNLVTVLATAVCILSTHAALGQEATIDGTPALSRGSTLTSVSSAQFEEHRWQMGRVRDHAIIAGELRCPEYSPEGTRVASCRTVQVWAEGTTLYSEQHSRGHDSGHRLTSWGGSIGLDVQMRRNWSVGIALAADYGDLEARAGEHVKGDFDSYYMSAWTQWKIGRWSHALVATFGDSEASLTRTSVNQAADSSPSGSSLGGLWEVTYDFYPVKDNQKHIIRPFFDVALTHTSIDAFSEAGGDNVFALNSDKQSRDAVTLALGARWLATYDTGSAFNHTMKTELHMNVAQDIGDRRTTADTAFALDPHQHGHVKGSRVGTTALQLGAGVYVPVARHSLVYASVGSDIRAHEATWNAAIGLRVGF